MSVTPIERLYRVTFPNPDELRAWRVRVLEYAATVGGLPASGSESRLVVFVPLLPRGHASVHAYVSEGARGLVHNFARGARVDTAVPLRELPDGLTLIYGEGVDASAYETRLRPEASEP
jgi:hypothetical protein